MDETRFTADEFDALVGAELWAFAPAGSSAGGEDLGALPSDDAGMATTVMTCMKCHTDTPHEVDSSGKAECVTCREIAAEALARSEKWQRQERINREAHTQELLALSAKRRVAEAAKPWWRRRDVLLVIAIVAAVVAGAVSVGVKAWQRRQSDEYWRNYGEKDR